MKKLVAAAFTANIETITFVEPPFSGEKINVFPANEQQESPQTTGAQAVIENLLRKTFPWGMPSRLPSNVKQELSSHLAEQGLGISDSRLNSIVSSIRKNW